MDPTSTSTEQKVFKARSRLLHEEPWFGCLAMALSIEETTVVPTMATNGSKLLWNKEFVDTLTEKKLIGVIAHEVMHCALRHMWRRSGRDLVEWNIACDYAINIILVANGFELPDGVYYDRQYEGWIAEAIFAHRRNEQELKEDNAIEDSGDASESNGGDSADANGDSAPNTPGSPTEATDGTEKDLEGPSTPDSAEGIDSAPDSSGGPSDKAYASPCDVPATDGTGQPCPTGEFMDPAEGEPEETDVSEVEWKIAAEQATRVAAKAGKLPFGISTIMNGEVRNAQTDWISETREFVQRLTPDDYTWRVPSRRNTTGYRMPGMSRDKLGTLVVAIDTSGSVSDSLYKAFMGEINGIVTEAKPESVVLIHCDSQVQKVVGYSAGQDVPVTRYGRGGTRFAPVFDRVAEDNTQPAALIYLTDCEVWGNWPEEPDYPVLWVAPVWATQEPTFGKKIEIDHIYG